MPFFVQALCKCLFLCSFLELTFPSLSAFFAVKTEKMVGALDELSQQERHAFRRGTRNLATIRVFDET